jgi:hypothetical protein
MPTLSIAKLLFCLTLIVSMVGAGWFARGWKDSRDVLEQKIEGVEKAQDKTESTKQAVFEIDKQLTKESEDAKNKIDALNSGIINGGVRFATKTANRVPEKTKPAGMDNGSATAELDREVSLDLISITADGDRAIRQLTACQKIVQSVSDQ